MGDDNPHNRLDKYGESEFSTLGMMFKDALFNKNRVERERKAAARKAARKARWKQSGFRKWLWRAVWFFVLWMIWSTIMVQLGWIA